jgi:hypothetical protein
MRNAQKILIGKPEGRRALVRRRREWENNTKMNLKNVCIQGDGFFFFLERH